MIEMCHLKNTVIFLQIILRLVLSRMTNHWIKVSHPSVYWKISKFKILLVCRESRNGSPWAGSTTGAVVPLGVRKMKN